jgi:D-alanine-D-alanine ligase
MNGGRMRIAVLAGGIGEERQVSLQSGKCVQTALESIGASVWLHDIAPNRLDVLDKEGIDVFFLALHGAFGEDGSLQQILKAKSLVYTGSGPEASRLAFDKMASKEAFMAAGIKAAPAVEFGPDTDIARLAKELGRYSNIFVVKPIRQGSSVGISIVNGIDQAIAAAKECLSQFGNCMIEKFIAGRELTVGILDGKTLPIIEIRPKSNFYDYQAKYVDEATEFLFDTIDDSAFVKGIEKAAMDCFNALGCRHLARVDFILGDDNVPYALEVNTIPGLTSHSLLPKAAKKMGMDMSSLCMKIAEIAVKDHL